MRRRARRGRRWWDLGLSLNAAAVACAPVAAQPVRQERRTVAWRADLLHALWVEARGAPADLQAKLDAALLTDQGGNPFLPLARVKAVLAGVPCDGEFVTRRLVHVNALPEIVDPEVYEDVAQTTPYRLHVTLHSPLHTGEARPFTFALSLADAAGEVVWRGEIGPTPAEDLAMFAATTAVPVTPFPDGAYSVRARTRIGDAGARATDPVGEATVFVQRGFAARALEVGERAATLLAQTEDPAVRAAVCGAIVPVHRVYTGDATDGTPDPIADLRHAVRVFDNVAAERAPLAGATGYVSLGFELEPSADPRQLPKMLHVRVRPAASDTASLPPLVLFAVGAPTWDGALARPSGVSTMPPGWMVQTLLAADFDPASEWVCATMQSLGEVADPTAAVARALATLGSLVPFDPERVLLVGERDSAGSMLACARPGVLPKTPRGVVVVAGGALGRAEIDVLEHTRLLIVPAAGHLSQENLQRIAHYAEAAGLSDRMATVDAVRAWPWALPFALPRIAAFARDLGF